MDYALKKQKIADRERESVARGQDVGCIPDVVDPRRKTRGKDDFAEFCKVYFPEAFYLPWSGDHLKAIRKIETAVRDGGLFALAMPRGSGKTTICQVAVLWAALYGLSRFTVLIAASADRARALLDNIKVWLETNPVLLEDFPEVCVPVRALERVVHRQKGQKCNGVPTRIEWLADKVVLPYVDRSEAAGCVITCSGLKGSDLRGQQVARADGVMMRPALVLVDDPQTSESAWSEAQSRRREETLAKDVLGMAGPGVPMSGLMACTVIRGGDMADAILDRKRHPEWHGERVKMLVSEPKNMGLWDKYAEMLRDELMNDGDGSGATRFYAEHREAMDEGAEVSWPERHLPNEISGIQHAMNLKIRDASAFAAEYQNDPLTPAEESPLPSVEELAGKLSGYPRGAVPEPVGFITAFVDVHAAALYWAVVGWKEDFSGYLLDYGTFPEQPVRDFTLQTLKLAIQDVFHEGGLESQVYRSLGGCVEGLAARWNIDRLLVDANWGQMTETVYEWMRGAGLSWVTPAHGRYIGATTAPMGERSRKPGERIGKHWFQPNIDPKRGVRCVIHDTNFWKTFLYARIRAKMGDAGSLAFYGKDPREHFALARAMRVETPVMVEAAGRRVEEWKAPPGAVENHWFDCLVGCAVAASMCGCELGELRRTKEEEVKRISFLEMRRGDRPGRFSSGVRNSWELRE